jgi:SPP1 gp7 family putative phage head morphogenesis protein
MPSSLQREQLRVAGVTQASVKAALRKTTRQPKAIEISYSGFLTSAQRSVNAKIRTALEAMNSILNLGARSDSLQARADDLNDDIARAFEALRGTVTRLTTATDGALVIGIANHGSKTVAFNDEKYNSTPMQLLGIGNSSETVERRIVRGWVRENVQLVGNMNAEQMGKLETLFLRALRDGTRSAQLQTDVESILNTSVNRARLIARDQIGKLNGQLDRQKQTEAGIESYVWRGSLDERERPAHVAREGDVFRWDQPPPDGNPGQPVQCRCSPEPNLAPLLGDEFAPAPDKPSAAERKRLEIERVKNNRRQAAKRRKRAARAARQSAS